MFCEVDNIKFYYEEYGKGIPILFFNGFATDLTTMKSSFEPIFKNYQQWKRIYIDHPGVGRTMHKDGLEVSEILNSFKSLVDKVTDGKTFLLVGASFGGYVSQYLLNIFKEQVNGLYLIYPMVVTDLDDADIENNVINKQNVVVNDDETKGRIQKEVIGAMNKTNFSFLEGLKVQTQNLHLETTPLHFSKPVCILTGRQDADVGYRNAFSLIKYFPKATYCVVDNASHNLQIEQSHLFNTFVADWLERVAKFNSGL